ncbi:MAG: hypothetical protein ACE14L_12755 [Terriglobales bacterium]
MLRELPVCLLGGTRHKGAACKHIGGEGEVQRWLVGAKMTSCGSDANGIWVCAITRDGGHVGTIVWNPDRRQQFNVPAGWHVSRVRDLAGATRPFSGRHIEIGPAPLMLENLPH